MKIASADLSFAASHSLTRQTEVDERLRAWVGARPPAADDARPAVVLSDAGREALAQARTQASAEAAAPAPAADDEAGLEPRVALIKALVEMLTGERIEVRGLVEVSRAATASAQAAAAAPAFGIEYDRRETLHTEEHTAFAASGTIVTADGARIGFSVALAMGRSETETRSVSLRAGNAVSKDPLVLNFDGKAAQLAGQRFRFDLLGDGHQADVPLLAGGSGYLVLDALGSGQVASGRQLFGPASGDGFADLAKFDSDGNGWIDEADPVFGRLGVWTPDAKGGGAVTSLAERGVGAVYLGRAATPFTLKDGAAELGAVRSSGLWVGEDGGVGTVQQVDLAV